MNALRSLKTSLDGTKKSRHPSKSKGVAKEKNNTPREIFSLYIVFRS